MIEVTTYDRLAELEKKTLGYAFTVRWSYYQAAARHVAPWHNTVLEIGPWKAPLVLNADYMDKVQELTFPVKYHFDARNVPWPIEGGQYDLVVALQFLEHMRGAQARVWKEMRRVARDAIISLPYKWDEDDVHRDIDEAVIFGWTGEEPTQSALVTDDSGATRIVLFYGEAKK